MKTKLRKFKLSNRLGGHNNLTLNQAKSVLAAREVLDRNDAMFVIPYEVSYASKLSEAQTPATKTRKQKFQTKLS